MQLISNSVISVLLQKILVEKRMRQFSAFVTLDQVF